MKINANNVLVDDFGTVIINLDDFPKVLDWYNDLKDEISDLEVLTENYHEENSNLEKINRNIESEIIELNKYIIQLENELELTQEENTKLKKQYGYE